MSTNQRRRERYATDPDYREYRRKSVLAAKEARRVAKVKEERLRGWYDISTVPDNETVILYDPAVFWPVVAEWNGKDWDCVHYAGPPIRPTHWRPTLLVPLP